ncbi:MAG: hypothetical protein IPL61_29805 [Myxococcales bacterium]|nr:hypothetical protein [Myxococcales bacterium]
MTTPVAVLAWRWRTALGADVDGAVARLVAGERGAIANPVATSRARTIAPIPGAPPRTRHDRYLRRMGAFGLDVATEVARAAALPPDPRTGLYAAVGGLRAHWDDMLPALARQRADGRDAWALGLREIHPFWMLRHLSNNAHALLAADLGARGDGATFGGASAGAQAIMSAAWALAAGAIDTAIVVAYDSLLEPELLVELSERGDVTAAAPADVIAPYHAAARGFVPGEAAAALVLVRPDDPRAGARTATIAAFAGAGDLAAALAALPVAPIVDGCARARPAQDLAERALIAAACGDAQLTATSAGFGHAGAATALIQTIALGTALAQGVLPPVAGAGAGAVADGPLTIVTSATPTTARAALALSVGAPDLVAAVRVSVP